MVKNKKKILFDNRGLNFSIDNLNNLKDGFYLFNFNSISSDKQMLAEVFEGKLKNYFSLEKNNVEDDYTNKLFLELPELTKKVKTEKNTKLFDPKIDMLTKEQFEVFEKITNLKIKNFSQSLITGYSGTVKTFLVSKIVEKIIFDNSKKNISIAITAPTNKAVKVLKNTSNISEDSEYVSFITLHSLLSLKRTITADGKEVYERDSFNPLIPYDVVLVDEVSMLDNSLYKILLDYAINNKIMLLFIGDRGQIPPVNGGESVLFTSKLDNNYNLNKIIRQSEGNPIIKIAEKVRNGFNLEINDVLDESGNGVIFLKLNSEEEILKKYFEFKHFKQDPNFVKLLLWTNSAVDYYKTKVRKMIYGENCGKLCIGEKMVCNKPILNSKKQVILNNNDEFDIVSFDIKLENRNYSFKYYSVKISCDNGIKTIKILHEDSYSDFNKTLKKLKSDAQKLKTGFDRVNSWKKYYGLLERYADVKYNYSLTIHKSQGSTFDNCIVLNCDIKRNKDLNERNKLLYTAITRAKNKLIII